MVTIPVMRRDHYDADNDGVVDESGASLVLERALSRYKMGVRQ